MAIRVLARIPEITAAQSAIEEAPEPAAGETIPPLPVASTIAPADPAAKADPPAASPAAPRPARPVLPASGIPRRPLSRRGRTDARPRLPLASILALALVTLGIWSLVAYRETDRRDPQQPAPRMAASGESPVIAPETTLR